MNKAFRFKFIHIISFALVLLVTVQSALAQPEGVPSAQEKNEQEKNESEGPSLTIGSRAPSLDIEHWVSDGEGKFKHIKKFEKGKVYIVEFWATWCGPCIAAMPHISGLQKKHAKDGLQIISVSDEVLEKVEAFLERPAPGTEADATYGSLTRNYCLTTDPDRSVSRDYMEASGQGGIPTAFIVGKSGLIEWVGHPMEIDEPLEKVISGKWDRKLFAVDYEARQKFDITMAEVSRKFRAKDMDGAVTLLEKTIQSTKSKNVKQQASMIRLQLLVTNKHEKAAKAVQDFAGESEDAEILNNIAWNIFQMSKQTDVEEKVLAGAVTCAEKATKLAPKKGYIWDTLAHLVYDQGNLDQAIEHQKKAIANTDGLDRIELQDFLKKMEDEKAKSDQ